ncbi:hypothetical protein P3X46_004872 [Hevea brasiliensis]|uniref:Kinesin motor domain-containing protein n=1 Tax=Hevea brasiliensis TaxID=3981 RepID=A0ABQ9N2Z9_HEVBR|nr:hypothetical protein P3X46_004872 [Hevea brasiliensis]
MYKCIDLILIFQKIQSGSLITPRPLKTSTLEKPMDCNFICKVSVILRVCPFPPYEIAAKNGTPNSYIFVIDQDCKLIEEVTVRLKDLDSTEVSAISWIAFFGQEDNSVRRIFEREVNPLITGIFHCYNATVFAYELLAAEKPTPSLRLMLQGTDQLPGLVLLSVILSICQSTRSKVELSYYEAYLDRCYDLIELRAKEIAALDDKDGQTLSLEFQDVFSRGAQRRTIAHIGLNDVSSRSHGVLLIGVSTPCSDGNEVNKRTCNVGIHLQKSAKINHSLFVLSNVVHALNNSKPRVPYQESKLTRILQESLGETSHALLAACLNLGEYQESVHTVSMAARSRRLSNVVSSTEKLENPKVKVDRESKLQAWFESKGKTRSIHRSEAYASPFPVSSIKQPYCQSTVKAKVNSNQRTSNAKERAKVVPFRILFNTEGFGGDLLISFLFSHCTSGTTYCFATYDHLQFVAEHNREENSADSIENVLKSATQKPLLNCTCNFQNFNVHNSVMQEYIEFLNIASREELLEIKGIGQKMAKCIVDLRETSPLNSLGMSKFHKHLSDLEKLGLSSKQVHNMFSRAARGIFDRQEVHTPLRSETLQVEQLSMDTSSIDS